VVGSPNFDRYAIHSKDILEEVPREDEIVMLRHFLGSEPNSAAFLKSLGIQ